MDDLTAFVSARLDEDEAAARKMADMLASADASLEPVIAVCFDDGASGNAYDWNPWDRIADYDPARALREVAAKREIVAAHHPETPSKYGHDVLRCAVCQTERGVWAEDRHADPWPCQTLRALASPWSDHPDYRAEWAPER